GETAANVRRQINGGLRGHRGSPCLAWSKRHIVSAVARRATRVAVEMLCLTAKLTYRLASISPFWSHNMFRFARPLSFLLTMLVLLAATPHARAQGGPDADRLVGPDKIFI